ncbi:hypothetical protein [Flexivirga caeni]|uniref:hypothetical protein n=1 Tax=Flexivirga caeni TaxID=2294115 RepID=UPI001FE568B6|nr:hypothetical protein [Flexivirga caeni]
MTEALETVRLVRQRAGYQFWPDSLSYADCDLAHVRGHRQVADAYLAALAGAHDDARLATLDGGPVTVLSGLAFLVPDDHGPA